MDISQYEEVGNKIDKNKTWINVEYKVLLSREIKSRPYYKYLKKFNPLINSNEYFIVLYDSIIDNGKGFITNVDKYGRCKFRLSTIWRESSLSQLDSDCNIVIEHISSEEDGDIYKLSSIY